MKRDIKVNYGIIQDVIDKLQSYASAIENMKAATQSLKEETVNSEGLAVNELMNHFTGLDKELDSIFEEVNELHVLLKRYHTEMTSIMSPTGYYVMTRVSRNDIYWNIQQIDASVARLSRSTAYDVYNPNFTVLEDHQIRNKNKLSSIKDLVARTSRVLYDKVDALDNLYTKKVKEYENRDDYFSSLAENLASKSASLSERKRYRIKSTIVNAFDWYTSLFHGLVEVVNSTVFIVKEGVVVVVYLSIYGVTSVFGSTPDFILEGLNKRWEIVKAVINDPIIIVEGMLQGFSDTIEDKGLAYAAGYIGADLAAEIIVFKGLGKISKVSRLDNVLKVDTGFRVSLSDWDSAKIFFKDHPDYPSATEFFKPKNGYKPYNSPTPQNWFKKGGTLEIIEVADGTLTFRYTIDIDGVPVSVDYVGGVPKLDGFVVHDKGRQDIELTGDRTYDELLANKAAGYDDTPEGYTWHHDMPCGKMLLIPDYIHRTFTH